ncbi:hypothetical protein [Streptomyces sp. NRRL F-2664]|uniref:hypothetical protein n=1 Tax=Streptomyces sp. NRRL F-2664 TaxID=1463842 RepID=UPI0004CC317E|nr:hypothetical protein [Streptomyces sp. NRRL F-2664]
MNHPVPATAPDSEALRAVIEAAIVNYLDGAAEAETEAEAEPKTETETEAQPAPDPAALAAHVTAAVERLLAAGPPAEPVPEGDEI